MIPYGGPLHRPPLRPSTGYVRPALRIRAVLLFVLFIASVLLFVHGQAWYAGAILAAWYATMKIWKSL